MPSSGETLSLNNLAGALGETQNSSVSLNSLNSSAGTQVSLSDYYISAVDNDIDGYTYAVEATNETYTMTFANEGSKFGSIKGRGANFTWAVSPAFNSAGDTSGFLSIGSNSDYTAVMTGGARKPQGASAQSSLS